MIEIAAVNASTFSKSRADFVCDGINDEVEILSALEALPTTGGAIRLSEGSFNLSNRFPVTEKALTVVGAGMQSTVLNFATTDVCIRPRISWTLRDFSVIGNGSVEGIRIASDVYYCNIERIFIDDVSNVGLYTESGCSQH